MRSLLYRALHAFGAVALMRFFHRNSLTILLYHGVAPHEIRGIFNYRGKFISPEAFDVQLQYFKKHYTVLELDDAIVRMRAGTLPKYSLAITFDDGYRNFYTHAYPILKKYNIVATMFLATDFVFGKKPLWVDRLEYMTDFDDAAREEKMRRDDLLRNELKQLSGAERDARLDALELESRRIFRNFEAERAVYAPLSIEEIRELHESGMRFGAHTKSHPILSRETPDIAAIEIRESVEICKDKLGTLSSVFAYPNGQPGDWTESNEQAVKDARCTSALTTIEGVNMKTTHPFRLQRMTMDATDHTPAFAAIASGVRLYMSKIKKSIYAN